MIHIPLSTIEATLVVMIVMYAVYKFGALRGYSQGIHDGSILTVDLLRKNGYIGKDEKIVIKTTEEDLNE